MFTSLELGSLVELEVVELEQLYKVNESAITLMAIFFILVKFKFNEISKKV
jgi:hypothetical protein